MEHLRHYFVGLGILVVASYAEAQVSVVEVAVGSAHACALTTSGGVKCWGANSFGELGDGTTVSRPVAGDVPSLTGGVKAISAGAA